MHAINKFVNTSDLDFEVLGVPKGRKLGLMDFYEYFKNNEKNIPWRELEQLGWIGAGRDVTALAGVALSFLDGGTERSLFRKNQNANDLLYSIWNSRVEQMAIELCIANPKIDFSPEGFTAENLSEIASLSEDEQNIANIKSILEQFGIILVYERAIAGSKTDGVVSKLPNGIPYIGMTLRYDRIDYFWFTLMHELAHIVLHFDELDSPILEEIDAGNSPREIAANRLAQSSFIPRHLWTRCPPRYEKTDRSIVEFARKQRIHPAIVAGMLRKETNDYSRYSGLVNSVSVREILED
jgi:HTH-type transcriptional regulator/antitoxin HigA